MREKGGAAYGEDGAHGPAALRPHLAAGIAGAGPVPGGAGRLSGAIERTGGREYSGEDGGCGGACLAGRAMGSIRLIQDFIEDELADRRTYLAYAACAPNVAARRLLRQLAGEEGSHARRLMGVYYLVTGCCYQPRLQGGRVERLARRVGLRTGYHAATCGGLCYAPAAELPEDVCLREIWEELSAAEYRHARQLLSLLEQMVLA